MMTVREFIQQILLESPNLETEVYIQKCVPNEDYEDYKDYDVTRISSEGSDNGLFIEVEDWRRQQD